MYKDKPIQRILKRVLDLFVSLLALIILAIPMSIIAILIGLESGRPVFFKQERVGMDGVKFTLYKFRSMKNLNEESEVFHNEDRITSIGRFIRKWRIDELPQLYNVLKGEMSIVGPRPTLPYQIERYNSRQRKRLTVKPGVTGWSQVHGDKAISWPERIEYDIWYVENWSLWLDLKIIFLTPFALLRIKGINVEKGPPPDEISDLKHGGSNYINNVG